MTPPPVVMKEGAFTREAEVQSQERISLADSPAEALKAVTLNVLRLSVQIALGGEPKASGVRARVMETTLAKVKKGLELK